MIYFQTRSDEGGTVWFGIAAVYDSCQTFFSPCEMTSSGESPALSGTAIALRTILVVGLPLEAEWRCRRDCSEHAQGMFLVLANARIARVARAQNRLPAILSNKGPFTSPARPIKRAHKGPF
jgi:hypothetical protein